MIKTETKLNILHSTVHVSYRSNKGKIEQSLYIGRHSTGIDPLGPFPGACSSTFTPGVSSSGAAPPPSSGAPSSSQAAPATPTEPSTSRGRWAPKSKKGKLEYSAQGMFACFNMCRQNSQEIREHRRYMDEELLKLERRQKEIMAKVDLPYSPVREPRDFPTPPRVYNPWDDYVPQENPDDDVEFDYGGQEMPGTADDEEEEAGDDEETESDDDGDDDSDDNDDE